MAKVIPVIEDRAQQHAKLSPSGSFRWLPCPGSVQAEAELRDPNKDDSNPDSRLGTAAHALLEVSLVLDRDPEAFIGSRLAGKDHPPVDEDMCDWVRVALDYVQEYVDMHGEENLIVLPESKVYIGSLIGITDDDDKDDELCNGTSDLIIAHRDMSMCIVLDYKNGVNKVSAERNPQCMLYAGGARARLGKFRRYRSVIVQPRAGKRSPIEEWEYSDSVLRKFLENDARKSARAALLPGAPRTAGDHCRWCKAAPRCRTRRDRAAAIAGTEFSAIEDAEPDPSLMTNEELLEALNATDFLQAFIHSTHAYAMRLLERDPNALPGWAVGWTKRQRIWDDRNAVIGYCDTHGISVDEYAPRELLSPAQMEKLIRRRVKARRRRRGEAERPDPTAAWVTYSVPTAKLVRATDATEEFDVLD